MWLGGPWRVSSGKGNGLPTRFAVGCGRASSPPLRRPTVTFYREVCQHLSRAGIKPAPQMPTVIFPFA